MFVWFLLVALAVVASSACAPAPAPTTAPALTTASSAAQPTITVKPTIRPDRPLGALELLYAGPIVLYFDKGVEAAYQNGFNSMQPKEALMLIENQLIRIKAAYPGVAPGIDRAFNDAGKFAWDSFAQYLRQMKAVGLEPSPEDADEIMTAARAFSLARAYMKLKVVDWARFISSGSQGMNLIPIFMIDPAVLCGEIGSKAALYHLCGRGDYTNQQ